MIHIRFVTKNLRLFLGYSSPAEWAKVENPLETNVYEKSQKTVVSAYQDAMDRKVGSKIDVKMKKKSGSTVDTTVIMVPVAYQGHLFALHFISEKK